MDRAEPGDRQPPEGLTLDLSRRLAPRAESDWTRIDRRRSRRLIDTQRDAALSG